VDRGVRGYGSTRNPGARSARLASSARRLTLHLPRDWPWELTLDLPGSGLETERGQQLTRVCAKVLQQDGSIAVAEPDLRGLGPDRTRSGDHPTWFVGHAPQ